MTQQTPAVHARAGGVERGEAMPHTVPHTVECVSGQKSEARREEPRFSCFVKMYDGSYLCLDVSLSDGVSVINELVHAKCGIEPRQQRLTYVWSHCRGRHRRRRRRNTTPWPRSHETAV